MVPAEGFGFIDSDDGHEYFFHRTALNGTRFEDLAPGVAVDFRIGRGEGDRPDEGPRAIFVRLADVAEPAVDPPMDRNRRAPVCTSIAALSPPAAESPPPNICAILSTIGSVGPRPARATVVAVKRRAWGKRRRRAGSSMSAARAGMRARPFSGDARNAMRGARSSKQSRCPKRRSGRWRAARLRGIAGRDAAPGTARVDFA